MNGKGPERGDSAFADLSVDRNILSEGVELWQTANQLYLPFKSVAISLGFRLKFSEKDGLVSGFLRRPSDWIEIDLKRRSFRLHHGNSKLVAAEFSKDDLLLRDRVLYISSSGFEKVTRCETIWNSSTLELRVSSRDPLPLRQQNLLRETSEPYGWSQKSEIVIQKNGLASIPSWDLSFGSSVGSGSTGPSETQISAVGYGDLFFLNAQYQYLSGNLIRPQMLMSLGQEDESGKLLGPMQASNFRLGYMALAPLPLIARFRTGIGASIGNRPLEDLDWKNNESLGFKKTPGTLIELYRSDALIASKTAQGDQTVTRFNIGLEPGRNDILVVTVSPTGDVQENTITRYRLSGSPVDGKSAYDLVFDQPRAVIDQETREDIRGMTEVIGQLSSKASEDFWLDETLAGIESSTGTEIIGGVGSKSYLGGELLSFDVTDSSEYGLASSAGISTDLHGKILSLAAVHHFESSIVPDHPSNNALVASLHGMSSKRDLSESYDLALSRSLSSDPTPFLTGGFDIESRRFGASTYVEVNRPDERHEASGSTDLRYASGHYNEKLTFSYDGTQPGWLTQAAASCSTPFNPAYFANLGLTFNRLGSGTLLLNAGCFRRVGNLAAGLNFDFGTTTGVRVGLVLSSALTLENEGPGFLGPGTAALSRARVRVFLDNDGSGKYHSGDVLLSGVAVKMNGHRMGGVTSPAGVCEINNLPTGIDTEISLDEDSLPDPTWLPSNAGCLIRSKPGKSLSIDLGVSPTAEIEGNVSGVRSGTCFGYVACLRSVSSAVELSSPVDESGGYGFSRVKAGGYRLVLLDESKKVCATTAVQVNPGQFASGFDLVVSKNE